MVKKDSIRGIVVNEDSFDFKTLTLKYLDSIQDFNKVMQGKGFDMKKSGYTDVYIKLCSLFDVALSHLDFFIDTYSIDFIDERYKERDSSYENSKFIY